MVCDAHLAEDVTQGVFVALAKNAGQLKDRPVLSGWLHRAAQHIAAQTVRADVRRRAREQEAAAMNQLLSAASDAPWERIAPHLDAALGELNDAERDALLLRYFEKKSAPEMAGILGISDEAAQKRVSRAVERVREFFAKHGVTVGASGLVVLISANAVQAAPAGLAVTISVAAVLAGTTLATTATATATKAIAMTTLQKALVTATVAVLAGAGIYQTRQASHLRDQVQTLQQQQAPSTEQIQQLQRERDGAVKKLADLSAKPLPHLPAPPIRTTPLPSAAAAEDLPSANLLARLNGKDLKLTAEQVESCLKANGRKAASLLAAFHDSGNSALLEEAMQKFPNDPQVALEAAFQKDASPEQRRQWLDAFKQSAPDNALANYLSALDNFKAGRTDQAVQELIAASGKQKFEDYLPDRIQNDEEAYLSAGYPLADSKAVAIWQRSDLPRPGDLRELVRDMRDLANSYRQAGDAASAQAVMQMIVGLGERYRNSPQGRSAVIQNVGMSIESFALATLDPRRPYGSAGQTVQDRLNQIREQFAAHEALGKQFTALLPTMSDQDWIGYCDRMKTSGEDAAWRWLIGKYGQK